MNPHNLEPTVESVPPNADNVMNGEGEYLLLHATLANADCQNIGVLLFDPSSDRLYCRFRGDLDEFAGDETDWFKELPQYIPRIADELGGSDCLEWLESTLSNSLRISSRTRIAIDGCPDATVDRLYATNIRPAVLSFSLTQHSLKAAAGVFCR